MMFIQTVYFLGKYFSTKVSRQLTLRKNFITKAATFCFECRKRSTLPLKLGKITFNTVQRTLRRQHRSVYHLSRKYQFANSRGSPFFSVVRRVLSRKPFIYRPRHLYKVFGCEFLVACLSSFPFCPSALSSLSLIFFQVLFIAAEIFFVCCLLEASELAWMNLVPPFGGLNHDNKWYNFHLILGHGKKMYRMQMTQIAWNRYIHISLIFYFLKQTFHVQNEKRIQRIWN